MIAAQICTAYFTLVLNVISLFTYSRRTRKKGSVQSQKSNSFEHWWGQTSNLCAFSKTRHSRQHPPPPYFHIWNETQRLPRPNFKFENRLRLTKTLNHKSDHHETRMTNSQLFKPFKKKKQVAAFIWKCLNTARWLRRGVFKWIRCVFQRLSHLQIHLRTCQLSPHRKARAWIGTHDLTTGEADVLTSQARPNISSLHVTMFINNKSNHTDFVGWLLVWKFDQLCHDQRKTSLGLLLLCVCVCARTYSS